MLVRSLFLLQVVTHFMNLFFLTGNCVSSSRRRAEKRSACRRMNTGDSTNLILGEIDQLPLVLQRQQHHLCFGMRVQNNVLTQHEFPQIG